MRRERFRIAIKTPIFVVIFAILALLCMAGVGSAVVYHGNEVIDTDTTWSADVHVINASSVQVSDGVTLTISPGAVVKFESANARMFVYGTLNASGAPADNIVFTSLNDDSYGGDTNNDGDATSPAPGDGGYIWLYGSGSYDGIGIFDHCILRYGGYHDSYPANIYSLQSDSFTFKNSVSEYSLRNGIYCDSSSPVIISSTFHNNSIHGLYSTDGGPTVTSSTFSHNGNHGICSTGGSPTVTNNTFTNNTNYATYLSDVTIMSFRDNTGSGNGKNGCGIGGTVSTNQIWNTTFPYIILNAGVTVSDGITLTLEPGVVVKFESANARMFVYGTLNASGAPADNIVFTSLKDDSYGGDTNNDGDATSPAPGDGGYIWLYGSGSYDGIGIFDHCILRYGGYHDSYPANIYSLQSDSFTFKNSVSEYSLRNGIYLSNTANSVITKNTIKNSNGCGIYVSSSTNNEIYLNNFTGNSNNVCSYSSTNFWNSTVPMTYTYNDQTRTNYLGNYWDDYTDIDADNDGIWDNPYSIGGDNDYYSLVVPWENYFAHPENKPPVASFTYTIIGLTANFTSTSHDPDGAVVSHHWNFGDGTTSSEENPTHIYPASGRYSVTLTVEDFHGRVDSATEEISISSKIASVSCPSKIAKGLPLHVEVATREELSILLSFGGFSETKYGKYFEFNVDTSGFDIGEYELTVNAEEDVYKTSVRIWAPKSYRDVIHELTVLECVAETEMHEISWMTGYSFMDIAYDMSTEKIGEAVLNELCEKTLNSVKTEFWRRLFNFETELMRHGLSEAAAEIFGKEVNEAVNRLGNDFLGEIIARIAEAGYERLEIPGTSIVSFFTDYLTEPVVYSMMCSQEMDVINERTEGAENEILSQSYTDGELVRMKEIITVGKEAIRNTDSEKVYRLHFTIPIVKKDINAEPTMYYFKESHYRSLNPGAWGFGKYNPKWVLDMTLADAQSVLTIPAELGWIEATPENEEIRSAEMKPMVAFIPAIVGAITTYMKIVKWVEILTPFIISGGMSVSTDLLADEISEEHNDTIDAMFSEISSKSVRAPELVGNELLIPKGDIVLTITPDGRIVDIDHTKMDMGMKLPAEYKIVSLNARSSYKIEEEELNVTMQLIPNKENYEINETANVTLRICNNMDETINETLLWFFIPSENLTIKDLLTLSANSEVVLSYEFNVSNESLHVPTAYLTLFDEIIAEGHCSFTIEGENQKGAVLTVDYKEYYDPGEIKMNVTVENVGNVEISTELLFDNISLGLPTLDPKEITTETVTFNLTEPGIYAILFNVMERNKTTFDSRYIEFTVRAIDTLFAFPTTDKPIYNLSEMINISVIVKNATLHQVIFPHELNTVTPSGKVLNETNFIASENGTYVVKASPIATGYATIPGEALFMVERQSDLSIEFSSIENATLVYVKTDACGVVEDASVILNGIEKDTDANGIAKFEYLNATELFIKAEKFGFNPTIKVVNVTENHPPIANFTYTPENPDVNQTITFNASSSYDPDGNITNYEWNFGDGNITNTTEQIILHSYALAGNYNVSLTVTDNEGTTNTRVLGIAVSSMPDLVVTENWVCWPDNCTICYNVTNIGNEIAPGGHNTTLFVDSVETAYDHVAVALEPNESYIGCFDGYNWTYTPPEDNITVCADSNNTVAESNETNNCMVSTWKCGDVDGNCIVNVMDARLLMKHVADPTGYPVDPWAGDVNGEGDIDGEDVQLLLGHVFDPEAHPLKCRGD